MNTATTNTNLLDESVEQRDVGIRLRLLVRDGSALCQICHWFLPLLRSLVSNKNSNNKPSTQGSQFIAQ